jgi:glutamate-1-semialdehyde 2,1-aminomutase
VWFCSAAHDDRAVQHVLDALPAAADAVSRLTGARASTPGGDR